MNKVVTTSNDHVDGLVRRCFGVEPGAMAALAHGDEEVRRRRLPDVAQTTDPLDGLEVFVRQAVAICVAMHAYTGPVTLVTEHQAATAGWPSARLANLCIVLAWTLSMTGPTLALPLLIDADNTAGDAMTQLIRIEGHLPALEELRSALNESNRINLDAMERIGADRERTPALAGIRIAAAAEYLTDWLGINVEGVELPTDRSDLRLQGANARAVGCFAWLIISALNLGSVMEREGVEAVRLKTERDAWLAGEPGAAVANCALLLGAAIRHGSGYTVHFLPPDDKFAAAVVEVGSRIRDRRNTAGHGWETDEGETKTVEELELEDIASRGYVHVGRYNAKRVAWRQVREDT